MKILWITNIQFPATCKVLGIKPHIGGGWMYSLAMELKNKPDLALSVCTVYNGTDIQKHEIDDITYYLLPKNRSNKKYDKLLEPQWKLVTDEFQPDIVHIHGTEFAHGLACMEACPQLRYIISIQGLIGIYGLYYYAGISKREILRNLTLIDIKNKDSILEGRREYLKRGRIEVEYLRKTQHIIGRTSWDLAHVKAVNPGVNYHFCNEVLRKAFYASGKWNISGIKRYSIFISQASYPIKGLHQALKALQLVKSVFPDTQLRIAGDDITGGSSIKERLKISGYGSYIRSLLNRLNLRSSVTFVGPLSENDMIREFLDAHVFLCPSSIENSPNSLGEAQITGTPCVASYVGGIPDMVTDGETGLLYRFDDHIMLAFQLIKIFSNDKLASDLSQNGQVIALQRHDKDVISSRMADIYRKVEASDLSNLSE